MEQIARTLANSISKSLEYDDERQQVIAYGLIAIIQTVVTVLSVFIISMLIGTPIEALILCFSVSFLRRYTGGAHVGFIGLCTSLGVIYCVLFSVISRYVLLPYLNVYWLLIADLIVYALSYMAIYKLVPVDSPNKPITTIQKKKRMRKGSYITLSIFLLGSISCLLLGMKYHNFFSYGISLVFGIAWQIFTLTEVSTRFLYNIESIICKIFHIRKEVEQYEE